MYTISIWTHYWIGYFPRWLLISFGLALTIDIYATIAICYQINAGVVLTWHSFFGFLALGVMSVHFLWAVLAYTTYLNEYHFSRYARMAWFVWLISFLSPTIPVMM